MNQEISKLNIIAARFIPITVALGAISVMMNLREIKDLDTILIVLIFLLAWLLVILGFKWMEKTKFKDLE